MRKTLLIAVILGAMVAGPFARVVDAATQTHVSNFTLAGSTGEQTLQGVRIFCDDCAPDSLIDCGGNGCGVAGGVEVSLTSALSWTAPFEVSSTNDPDTLHQGTFSTVTNSVTPKAGKLTLQYALHYTIGLFGKGGNFPSDDWHASTASFTDTITKSADATCTPPLTGDGNSTCQADVSIPFFDECFGGDLCPVEITVSLIVHNTITISPSGFVVHREATFQSARDLTLGSSAANDPLTIPCSAPVGSAVDYTLSDPSYNAPVSVTGSLGLGIFIDGPGPANFEDDVDLPISGNVFNGSIGLSSGEDSTFSLGNVLADNVAPTLSATIPSGPYAENSSAAVSGSASDNCPVSASIDWGEGTVDAIPAVGTSLNIAGSHTYGDNGGYLIRVCAADAYVSTCRTGTVTFTNVDPTAAIGTAGQTVVNGQTAFLAHAGEPVAFSGRSTDPGSDDLTLTWDWGDGAPSPDVTTFYAVNPPLADPPLSPSVQPRDETDPQVHTFGDACLYTITFAARDDDGGTGSQSAKVVIVGNATRIRSAGYWQTNMVNKGTKEFSATRLNCYLAAIGFLSSVFNEKVDASTISKAAGVLKLGAQSNASPTAQFDRQLLAAWLNFVNGSVAMDQLFDTNGDGVADTTFATIIANAETVRSNPSSTSAQLVEQKNILERVNQSMGG